VESLCHKGQTGQHMKCLHKLVEGARRKWKNNRKGQVIRGNGKSSGHSLRRCDWLGQVYSCVQEQGNGPDPEDSEMYK